MRARLHRSVRHAAGEQEDADPDQHLAREHPPPRGVRGRQTADQGTDGDRDRAGGADQPVGPGPALGWEVPRHERHDRRHDERRPDPLEDRPSEEQHREVRREGGRQRSRAIDREPEDERSLATDDRADLPTRDHQHRHDEGVEDDRALDPRDRRAEVLRHRGDRDVHDRAVERHQELTGAERQQDDPGPGRGRRRRVGRARVAHRRTLPREPPSPAFLRSPPRHASSDRVHRMVAPGHWPANMVTRWPKDRVPPHRRIRQTAASASPCCLRWRCSCSSSTHR